ncbi:MAG: 3-hydroxyacyl-CoA dehydrogenase/enoyl-CoA hydratase family protein [Myxococcota bacterium]|jgi:3-hydroxyacyl-CoA dehydrogenase|nr:3-hydroxyacyl-CoA dehydrogenase/enoyl-CoA hydratase family protein [Myxococcota bacterium]
MTQSIESVAVLGSGVMGSAIAAHFAGCGVRTLMLDMPTDVPEDQRGHSAMRNQVAQTGLAKALKMKPAIFYSPKTAKLIELGNFEDDIGRLSECDLVIEVIVERLDIKQSLYQKIAPHISKDAVLASNTSGLSLAELSSVLPETLADRFLVMHFFNPVRYMHLLEIVPGPKTKPEIIARAAEAGRMLGKGIVIGKDTPNFVANRIGVYGIQKTIHTMMELGLTIEEVDKIAGKPMGRPKSAAFRTADIVGLDTFLHTSNTCYDKLPDDSERDVFAVPEWIKNLIESGRLGQKTGAGFYKKEGKNILVLDPETLEYRAQNKVVFESLNACKGKDDAAERLKTLVSADDKAATFAWKVTASTLAYTARHLLEITDDILNVDRAMRWGYNWEMGPFEAWDAMGVEESVERMKKDGYELPSWVDTMLASGRKSFYEHGQETTYWDVQSQSAKVIAKDAEHLPLFQIKQEANNVVDDNLGASLVDLGDGCLCLEVHTKMNTIDNDVTDMMNKAVDEAEKNFEALVIGNDGQHFGAGANLLYVFMSAQQKDWTQIEYAVETFQSVNQRLKYAKVPVVAAPFQYAFGGACEISMSCDAIQAHAETYIGLVEVGVGLVPAGAGCLRMVERWTNDIDQASADPLPFLAKALETIALAKVGTGAEDARRYRYLLPEDGITLNREHLLSQAKWRALGLARAGYRAPLPQSIKAAGLDVAQTMVANIKGMHEAGYASEHDARIGIKIAHILCGGDVATGTPRSEQDYLDLEKEGFVSLCGEEKTQARMQSILMSNKPLRN